MPTPQDIQALSGLTLSQTTKYGLAAGDDNPDTPWKSLINTRLKVDGNYVFWKTRGGTTVTNSFFGNILTVYPFQAVVGNTTFEYLAVHTAAGKVYLWDISAETSDEIIASGLSTTMQVQFANFGTLLFAFDYDGGTAKYYNLADSTLFDFLSYNKSYITAVNYLAEGIHNENIWGFAEGDDIIVFPNNIPDSGQQVKSSADGDGVLTPSDHSVNSFLYIYNEGKYLVDSEGNEYKQTQYLTFPEGSGPFSYTVAGSGADFTIEAIYIPLDEAGNPAFRSYRTSIDSISEAGFLSFEDPVGITVTSQIGGVPASELVSTNLIFPYSSDLQPMVGKSANKQLADDSTEIQTNQNYNTPKIYRQYVIIELLNDGSVTVPGKPFQLEGDPQAIHEDGGTVVNFTVSEPSENVAKRFLCATRWQSTPQNAFSPSNENYENSPLFIVKEINTDNTFVTDKTTDQQLLRPITEFLPTVSGITDLFGSNQITPLSIAQFKRSLMMGGYEVSRPTPAPYTDAGAATSENIFLDIQSTTQLDNDMAVAFQFEYSDGKRSNIVETEQFLQEGFVVNTIQVPCDQQLATASHDVTKGTQTDGDLEITYEGITVTVPLTVANHPAPEDVAEAIRQAVEAHSTIRIAAEVISGAKISYTEERFGEDFNGNTIQVAPNSTGVTFSTEDLTLSGAANPEGTIAQVFVNIAENNLEDGQTDNIRMIIDGDEITPHPEVVHQQNTGGIETQLRDAINNDPSVSANWEAEVGDPTGGGANTYLVIKSKVRGDADWNGRSVNFDCTVNDAIVFEISAPGKPVSEGTNVSKKSAGATEPCTPAKAQINVTANNLAGQKSKGAIEIAANNLSGSKSSGSIEPTANNIPTGPSTSYIEVTSTDLASRPSTAQIDVFSNDIPAPTAASETVSILATVSEDPLACTEPQSNDQAFVLWDSIEYCFGMNTTMTKDQIAIAMANMVNNDIADLDATADTGPADPTVTFTHVNTGSQNNMEVISLSDGPAANDGMFSWYSEDLNGGDDGERTHSVTVGVNTTAGFIVNHDDTLQQIVDKYVSAINGDATISADWTASKVDNGDGTWAVKIESNVHDDSWNGTTFAVTSPDVSTSAGQSTALGFDGTENHSIDIGENGTAGITIDEADTVEQIVDKYVDAINAGAGTSAEWVASKVDQGLGVWRCEFESIEHGTASNGETVQLSVSRSDGAASEVNFTVDSPTSGGFEDTSQHTIDIGGDTVNVTIGGLDSLSEIVDKYVAAINGDGTISATWTASNDGGICLIESNDFSTTLNGTVIDVTGHPDVSLTIDSPTSGGDDGEETHTIDIGGNTVNATPAHDDSLSQIVDKYVSAINNDATINADWEASNDGGGVCLITAQSAGSSQNGTVIDVTGETDVSINITSPTSGGVDGENETHIISVNTVSTNGISIVHTDSVEGIVDKYIAEIQNTYGIDVEWEAVKNDLGGGDWQLELVHRVYGTPGNDKSVSLTGDNDVTVAVISPSSGGTNAGNVAVAPADKHSANRLQIHSLNALVSKVYILGRVNDGAKTFHLIDEFGISDPETQGMIVGLPNTSEELDDIENEEFTEAQSSEILEETTFPGNLIVGTPFQQHSISAQQPIVDQSKIKRVMPVTYDDDKSVMRYQVGIFTDQNIQQGYYIEQPTQWGSIFQADIEISNHGIVATNREGITTIGRTTFFESRNGLHTWAQGQEQKILPKDRYDVLKNNQIVDVVHNERENEYWFICRNNTVVVFDSEEGTFKRMKYEGSSIGTLRAGTFYGDVFYIGIDTDLCATDIEGVYDDVGQGASNSEYVTGQVLSQHFGNEITQVRLLEIAVVGQGYSCTLEVDLQPERLESNTSGWNKSFDGDYVGGEKTLKMHGTPWQIQRRAIMPRMRLSFYNNGAGLLSAVRSKQVVTENKGKARQ